MQVLAIALVVASCVWGGLPPASGDAEAVEVPGSLPNLVTETFGGRQFWSDELIYGDWRIQRHAITGHCRLLDGDDRRQAWGSYEQCEQGLAQAAETRELRPAEGHVVVLLHGLFRSRASMRPLADYLEENGRMTVVSVGYATTRRTVEEHAESLGRIVARLDGATRIDFVAHSLGNLVVRRMLADQMASDAGVDRRIRRMVMLGPPNRGAWLAEARGLNYAVRFIGGEAGRQLAFDWDALAARLVIPPCEFGIVAGGLEPTGGWNPLLPGDDDGTVRVVEAWLPGASDFVVVPVLHSVLMRSEQVQEYTLHFLESGRFPADADRTAWDELRRQKQDAVE